MRRLVTRKNLRQGVPLGLLTAGLCLPYVWFSSPPSPLRTMQLCYLPVVTVILALVTTAWSNQERPWREQWRPALRYALPVGLILACAYSLVKDRYLRPYLPFQYPASPQAVMLVLPWVGFFQTLVLVTGTYAFVFRLCRRRTAGLVGVILAHQGMLILQLGDLPPELLLVAVLCTGIDGFLLGWSYCAVGFAGPATVAIICHLRHLLPLLAAR